MRQLCLGIFVIVFVAVWGAGSPVQAVTQNLIYDCYSSTPVTLSVAPGDVLTFTSNCGTPPGAASVNTALFTSYPTSFSSWPQTFVVSPALAVGTYAAAFRMFGATSTTYTLVYASGSSAPAQMFSPPNWVQSHGRSRDEACRSGWNPSWAQWPNAGQGGFVCDRILTWQGETLAGN
jgi:hypothetical protein